MTLQVSYNQLHCMDRVRRGYSGLKSWEPSCGPNSPSPQGSPADAQSLYHMGKAPVISHMYTCVLHICITEHRSAHMRIHACTRMDTPVYTESLPSPCSVLTFPAPAPRTLFRIQHHSFWQHLRCLGLYCLSYKLCVEGRYPLSVPPYHTGCVNPSL